MSFLNSRWVNWGFNILTVLMVVTVIGTGALYFEEATSPPTDFYQYYGNVTTKDTFTYPDDVTSYTFGMHVADTVEIDFVNQMWCSPLGSTDGKRLIATRVKHFDEIALNANKLPSIIVRPIDLSTNVSQIGLADQEMIRSMADERGYVSWSMDNIRPQVSSTCYVSAEVTGYSTIFRLPKTITFDGNHFTYLVPE